MTNFAEFLRWSKDGSELFLRTVETMPDDEFTTQSLLPNWTKATVVAHVAYNAQALNNLVNWAISGIETPMYRSPNERSEQLERSLEMSQGDLREFLRETDENLSRHFSNLDDSAIKKIVVTAQGRRVPASELPWMRAKEVWIHAVDLDRGLTFHDFPQEFVDALLSNIVQQRHSRADHPSLVLVPTGRNRRWNIGEDDEVATTVCGDASEITSWLAGRRCNNLDTDSGFLPDIGPWF